MRMGACSISDQVTRKVGSGGEGAEFAAETARALMLSLHPYARGAGMLSLPRNAVMRR